MPRPLPYLTYIHHQLPNFPSPGSGSGQEAKMLSPRVALNPWVTNSWRLFFVILLPMCWFTGLLLRLSSDDDRVSSLSSPTDDDTPWEATDKQPPPPAASSTAKNTGSSSSPLLSPKPPPQPSQPPTPPFHWKGYSIKPVAYVFPQFHAIPENDRFWGENFTEWDNVRKVTVNRFGLETLRPAPEVGYYNILDYETRARQARLVRENGCVTVPRHGVAMTAAGGEDRGTREGRSLDR